MHEKNFLAVLGFELGAVHLLKQALYHLSHVPNHFCFSYFSGRVSFFSPQASLRP
jgi:hypothetical protein